MLIYIPRTLEYVFCCCCIFYKCQIDPVVNTNVEFFYILTHFLSYFFSLFIYAILSIVQKELLRSPNIIIRLSISLFNFISFCFTYLASLLFGAYKVRTAILSS